MDHVEIYTEPRQVRMDNRQIDMHHRDEYMVPLLVDIDHQQV